MDIVVGRAQPIGAPGKKLQDGKGVVEARILNVRSPRKRSKRQAMQHGDRRNQSPAHDPTSGRVMVLLVPQGYHLPRDIDSGNYRVFVRFAPRRRTG